MRVTKRRDSWAGTDMQHLEQEATEAHAQARIIIRSTHTNSTTRATNGNPHTRMLQMYQTKTPHKQHSTAHATKMVPKHEVSMTPTAGKSGPPRPQTQRAWRSQGKPPAPASSPRQHSASAHRRKGGSRAPREKSGGKRCTRGARRATQVHEWNVEILLYDGTRGVLRD